jgi:hypothetical protein
MATFYKWRSKYGGMDVSLIAGLGRIDAFKPGQCADRI